MENARTAAAERARAPACAFCRIVAGEAEAERVLEADAVLAFLDARPLQRGHCLLVPKRHVETLPELPGELVEPLFAAVRRLARAVQAGMGAEGSFVAVNNTVSQSVPHLHVHVVPRWRDDRLFSPKLVWRRRPYRSAGERAGIAERIRRALG